MSTATLPSMEFDFTLSVKGKETQRMFDGTFKYKRLTLGKRAEVDKMRAKLNEDMFTLSEDVSLYNSMVSFLRYGLVESPEWWRESNFGLDLYDINIITELYNKCMKFEAEWEAKVYGEDKAE